jgi:HK97 gp10 family phage protein
MARVDVRGDTMSNDSVKNVLKALKQFPKNVQKNIATGAVRAGCKPILDKAKALAPYEHGDLEKSIKITKAKSKQGERHIVHFRVSAGNFVQTAEGKEKIFYAAFIEWGHTSKNGKATMAYPFMRPAYEMEADKCINFTKAYYAKRIPKEIEKLKK